MTIQGAELKVLGLDKKFGNHQVLRSLDLEIPPSQFVAIIGRSGCGKSTLLRLIAGLDRPSGGGVLVDGEPLRQLNRSARVMFQDAGLLLWRRVQANVGLGLRHNWHSSTIWALQQVGLAARIHDWPAVLSGGQRQRVALARALVSQPRLLLLDEPLGALDALTRKEMQHLIETLWLEQHFTALLITHDVEEAVALADRVIMLEEGRVSLDQPIHLSRPRHRGSADFVELTQSILERIAPSELQVVQQTR